MRDIASLDTLLLPGWHNSDASHWQSRWEQAFEGFQRVEQADWERPVYADWAARLSEAVDRCRSPVLLVAHSLGTSLVTRWAHTAARPHAIGAFLVAPSDRDRNEVVGSGPHGFAPMLLRPLPFPSMVVASRNDERATFARAKTFAAAWGSAFVDAGPLGHIGSAAELGLWPQGLVWLGQFIASLPEAD